MIVTSALLENPANRIEPRTYETTRAELATPGGGLEVEIAQVSSAPWLERAWLAASGGAPQAADVAIGAAIAYFWLVTIATVGVGTQTTWGAGWLTAGLLLVLAAWLPIALRLPRGRIRRPCSAAGSAAWSGSWWRPASAGLRDSWSDPARLAGILGRLGRAHCRGRHVGSGGMTGPIAVGTSLRVCAAVRRAPHQITSETIAVPGWTFMATKQPLSADVAISPDRPGVVAVVHAAGGGAELDRVAHQVLRTLTRPRTEAWDNTSIAKIFNEACSVVRAGPSDEFRLSAALLAVRADGAIFAAAVGDIRIYRIVDGYAGQLTAGQPNAGDNQGSVTNQDRWLGGAGYREPDAYAVPSQHGDRLRYRPPDSTARCSRPNSPHSPAASPTRRRPASSRRPTPFTRESRRPRSSLICRRRHPRPRHRHGHTRGADSRRSTTGFQRRRVPGVW